ncbi:unnamed protein product [Heterobilharzia americana]|nr:unnamed protein product [Heterobilharzia americana]
MSYRYLPSLIRNAPRLKSRGIDILRDPRTNKGSWYGLHERQLLGIHGLLPPSFQNQDLEEQRIIANLYQLDDNLSRYMMLMSLQDLNEKLFYKTIRKHLEYCLPLIYTPTVGSACLNFGFVFRRPRGLYITIRDRGHIFALLKNWPVDTIKAVVMTDGERILGFGDLGANGMAIPLSKAILYVALGGVQPLHCLPIMLDVGTNNKRLLEASIGIARLLVQAIMEEGVSEDEAKSRIYMMDSQGLIVSSRHDNELGDQNSLMDSVRHIRPSVLIGASAKPGAFTRDILREMSTNNKIPIVFVLSNPSNLAECSAQLAYKATEWRCIFVSGSPSDPVQTPNGRLLVPSQGNNCYVFPGLVNALSLAVIRP